MSTIEKLKHFKRQIKPFLQMLFYNSICKGYIELFGKRDKRKLKYRISLCLIFNNEAPFLKEWLDYHIVVGIDHFYLYNNNSTDNYIDVVKPYVDNGVVTLINWPEPHSQFKAYKDCYDHVRNETNWLGFIDADEFICPIKDMNINDWIDRYKKYHAINIQWVMFGTGGSLKHDYNKNVIEQYFACWKDFYHHGKTLVNTRFDISNFDKWHVHHHTYTFRRIFGVRISLPAANQFKYICTVGHFWGGGKHKLQNASIQINHYYTKAWDIYSAKRKKADVLFEKNPKANIDYFYNKEMKCTSTNHTIQRFLIKLKLFQGIIE